MRCGPARASPAALDPAQAAACAAGSPMWVEPEPDRLMIIGVLTSGPFGDYDYSEVRPRSWGTCCRPWHASSAYAGRAAARMGRGQRSTLRWALLLLARLRCPSAVSCCASGWLSTRARADHAAGVQQHRGLDQGRCAQAMTRTVGSCGGGGGGGGAAEPRPPCAGVDNESEGAVTYTANPTYDACAPARPALPD